MSKISPEDAVELLFEKALRGDIDNDEQLKQVQDARAAILEELALLRSDREVLRSAYKAVDHGGVTMRLRRNDLEVAVSQVRAYVTTPKIWTRDIDGSRRAEGWKMCADHVKKLLGEVDDGEADQDPAVAG